MVQDPPMQEVMVMRGTVTRLVEDRRFGIIESTDGEQFFFHQSALNGVEYGELAEGITVEFAVDRDAKGDEPGERPRAVGVHLTDDAIPAVDGEALPPRKVR
jgi:CspA family cold shock protein